MDLRGELDIKYGDYFTGTFANFHPAFDWQINRHVLIGLGYNLTKYEFDDQTVFTREVEFELNVAFNAAVSLATKIEYDNVRREAAFTNRLRWNIEPGQDLWVVFNQGLVDADDDYKFTVEDTAAAFKFVYTLRL